MVINLETEPVCHTALQFFYLIAMELSNASALQTD